MLQGGAFCGWVDHELECHQFGVNTIDKLRPFSSTTTDDSDNTASVGNDSATATAATTAVGGTPTTSDNNNCIASVGCHDRVPGEIKRSRDLRGGRWSWTLTFAQKRSRVGRWSWAEQVGRLLLRVVQVVHQQRCNGHCLSDSVQHSS